MFESVEDEFVNSLIKSLKSSENVLNVYYGLDMVSDSHGSVDVRVIYGLKSIENVELVVEIGKDLFGDEVVKKVSYKTDRELGSEKEILNGKNVKELKKVVFSVIKSFERRKVKESAEKDLSVKQEIIERLKKVEN